MNGSCAPYRCFGDVFPDDPDRIRRPDASFIRMDRLRSGPLPQGHCDIVPDLVVEVISPNDLYGEVEDKVEEYLAAGVRLVWVIYPPHKAFRIHRANGSVQDLKATTELTGEDVIPGFRCPVSELFRRASIERESRP